MNGWCFKGCGLGFQESLISYEKNIPIPKNIWEHLNRHNSSGKFLGPQNGLGILKLSHNRVPDRPNKPLAYAWFYIPMNICLLNMDGEKASKRLFFDW